MKICHYVAVGFEIDGDDVVFPSPSASIATERARLPPDERRSFVSSIEGRFTNITSHDGLAHVERWGNGTLHWKMSSADESWESHVYVVEPLATALLGAMKKYQGKKA